MRSLPRLCTVFLSSFVLSLLSFWFPLSLHTGFGMERPSWMDRDCQDSSAQRALGWPGAAGTEPPRCHRAPQPPWAGGDGQFTARHWDLQVPRSPGGAFPHSGPAGAGWALPRGAGGPKASSLPGWCFTCSGVGRWEDKSRALGWGTHHLTWDPPGSCCCSPLWPCPPRGRLPPGTLSPSPTFHARSCSINLL